MTEATKTNRLIATTAALIIATALVVSAFSSDSSERALEVSRSLSVFDRQTVADIEQIAQDQTWETTADEVVSKTQAAAGWNICQEAIPAYLRRPGAATDISFTLRKTIKTLTPEVQTNLSNWIELVFGPIKDGVTSPDVALYINNDRCGFVKTTFNGEHMKIAEIFTTQMVAQ